MRIELALVLFLAGITVVGCGRKDGLNQSSAVPQPTASLPSVPDVTVPERTALPPVKLRVGGISEAELARQILEASPQVTIDEEIDAATAEPAEGEKLLCAELTR